MASLSKLKAHSRHVQLIKRILPVFAFLVVALTMVWPLFKENKDVILIGAKSQIDTNITMKNIHFLSTDNEKQPIRIATDSVYEIDHKQKMYRLMKPTLSYLFSDGNILTGSSDFALAYQDQETVFFERPLLLSTQNGWNTILKNVMCKYKTGTAASQNQVVITGPDGNLTADGVILYNRGQNINFTKNVKIHLLQEKPAWVITATGGAKIDREKQTITLEQNVRAQQADKTILADKAVLFYEKDAQTDKLQVAEIKAFHHVKALSQGHEITGERGLYSLKTNNIALWDNVVVQQGSSYANVERADMNMETGQITFTGRAENKGRVKGQLIPSELKQEIK